MLDHPALLWSVPTKESDEKEVFPFLVWLSDYGKFQQSTSLVQTPHSEDAGKTDWPAVSPAGHRQSDHQLMGQDASLALGLQAEAPRSREVTRSQALRDLQWQGNSMTRNPEAAFQ